MFRNIAQERRKLLILGSIEFELEKHSTLFQETMVAPVELAGFHEPLLLMGLGVSFTGGDV